MRKKVGIVKRLFTLLLIFLLSINSFAAIVSDNDGSAFITKAEFDALKSSFQSQIDSYNNSIDSKIDGAIASYLAGMRLNSEEEVELLYNTWTNPGATLKWTSSTTYVGLGPKISNENVKNLESGIYLNALWRYGSGLDLAVYSDYDSGLETTPDARWIRDSATDAFYFGKISGFIRRFDAQCYTSYNASPGMGESIRSQITANFTTAIELIADPNKQTPMSIAVNELRYEKTTNGDIVLAPRSTGTDHVCDLNSTKSAEPWATGKDTCTGGATGNEPNKQPGFMISNSYYFVQHPSNWIGIPGRALLCGWLDEHKVHNEINMKNIYDATGLLWPIGDGVPLNKLKVGKRHKLSVEVPEGGYLYWYITDGATHLVWPNTYNTITATTDYNISANTMKTFDIPPVSTQDNYLAIVYLPNSGEQSITDIKLIMIND